jgi:hypothetical protein
MTFLSNSSAQIVRLVPALLLLGSALALGEPHPPDMTPDWDGNGFNNSFERAVDIGQLTPNGVNIREQLGVVPWGFDTTDYYRFMFPGGVNDRQLSVQLDEQPDFTMWINIYDQSHKLVYASIGQANETFSIPLPPGIYYLQVLTSADVANGRNLQYTLSAKPVEIPLPDKGGFACSGAPNLGRLTDQVQTIEGNLNEQKSASVYSLYIPYGAALSGDMAGLQPSTRYTLTVIDRLTESAIPFRNSTLKTERILIDPGFYCLKIESVGSLGFGNYRAQISAARAGLMPGNDKNRAQNIIDMELGNLSTNGSYGFVSRYIHYQTPGPGVPNVPTVLEYGHEYVIRDWVGNDANTEYYWFTLSGKSLIELHLINQMASARAFIEDLAGNVFATSVVDSTSLNPALMPSQSLKVTLDPGRKYYIRIDYISSSPPGTSFGISLKASRAS